MTNETGVLGSDASVENEVKRYRLYGRTTARALLLGWLVVGVSCGGETDTTRLTGIVIDPAGAGSDNGGSITPSSDPAPEDGAGHAGSSPMATPDDGMSEGGSTSPTPDPAELVAQTYFGLPRTFARRHDAPELLSEMVAFTSGGGVDEETLAEALRREAPSLLPYDVQTPLWSDGAHKRRWLALPENEPIGFAPNGPWAFPEGTVFVKHFELALDERRPEQQRLLETRFLVAASNGAYYGVSYKWNAAGTDAELLRSSQTEELEIVDADGAVRRQKYYYPSPSDCLTCHNPKAGYVLGVHTAQLNGSRLDAASGREESQLVALQALGLLDVELEPDTSTYPRFTPMDDASSSLYDRVRSYLDSNCSMCHGARTDIQARWDARFETPLEARGMIAEPPFIGGAGRFLVAPSDADSSVLFQRVAVTVPGFKMPPLGRNRTDDRFVELLRAWIDSLPAPSPR
jgi:uncharacterized repeat protein (TIGR03806 family)